MFGCNSLMFTMIQYPKISSYFTDGPARQLFQFILHEDCNAAKLQIAIDNSLVPSDR